ncbi:hypothetical protein JHK87_017035 [Glycine soja]|nr:hypothetical protein JHK87_017035 [Glycine soja]
MRYHTLEELLANVREHKDAMAQRELDPFFLKGLGFILNFMVVISFILLFNFLLIVVIYANGDLSINVLRIKCSEYFEIEFCANCNIYKLSIFVNLVTDALHTLSLSFNTVICAMLSVRALSLSRHTRCLDMMLKVLLAAEKVGDLVSRRLRFGYDDKESNGAEEDRILLQCVSIGLARTVAFSGHSSLFVCLGLALLTEIFPLPRLYRSVFESSCDSGGVELREIREHLDGVLFKEAGGVTGVLCSQYVLADEESKNVVENLMWEYCRNVYFGHRRVAVMLKGKKDELLEGLEKLAESAFLMVVVFALAVTKHKLNSNFAQEIQMDVLLKILVSFSCVEYFRHVRLPEYMETIRKVVAGIKNEDACTSFVNSMPSYADLTSSPGVIYVKTNYLWSKDEVQTARILFYLRVIPTSIECLPSLVFRNMDSEKNDEVSLKEQLVFHYMQRSLLGYPGITPFEGMASGVVGMVQHLPAGSPAIFYCVHSLVEKANQLCSEVFTNEADAWKKWQGEPEPSKKLLDLLLRLVFLIDIQVLPDLMKLLAQLITKLPRDAQNIVLNELYSQVADSDDVVRKPTLVSWLQSLSYLCTKATNQNAANRKSESEDNPTLSSIADPYNSGRATARL